MAAGFSLGGCATGPSPATLSRHEFERPQMGVPFRIVLYAGSRPQAEAAAEAAYQRIAALNTVLSDYEDDSELTRLTRSAGTGQARKVSAELWMVLSRAQAFARLSDGAFDITAGPYVSLWRRARRIHRLPEPEKLEEARQAVGYEKLRLDARHRTAELLAPRMRLDLGAIAKGFAVDEALKTLAAQGIQSALVAGSGDLAANHSPPDRNGWRIEIESRDSAQAAAPKFACLEHRALATSGDKFQSVELEGRRYSHIVNPHTGLGLTDHSQVTVIARDCTTADALATTISVLGPERGMRLAEKLSAAVLASRERDGKMEQFQSRTFGRWLAD
jgi:thiamine biosynthesis lipoprotein